MKTHPMLLVLFLLLAPYFHIQSESPAADSLIIVNACGVTFQAPSDVQLIGDRGIGFCVRQFRGDNIYIVLNVGMGFTSKDDSNFGKQYAKKPAFQLKESRIDDNKAWTISFYNDKADEKPDEASGMNYVAALAGAEMGEQQNSIRMYVYCRSPKEQAEAQKIFESITFPPPPSVEEYKEPDPFTLMSAHHRLQLIERLNVFVEYNRKRQWGRVYDLLAPSYREGMLEADGRRPTKTDWIETQRQWHSKKDNKVLMNFQFEEVHLVSDDWDQGLRIEGCGEYEGKENQKARVNAFWEDNEWYFTDIETDYPRTGCLPKLMPYPRAYHF